MDTSTITGIFSERPKGMHWGSALALWDICRNKVIGVPVLDMFAGLAKDPELKEFISNGIERVAMPNIERIQEMMKKEGLTYPPMPQRKTLGDQQIAMAIREILRLAIDLDYRGFMETTRKDVRNLLWDVITDDKAAFDKIIELKARKNWLLNPPNV